jgi:hypothetical protein
MYQLILRCQGRSSYQRPVHLSEFYSEFYQFFLDMYTVEVSVTVTELSIAMFRVTAVKKCDWVISGFHRGENEVLSLLRCYSADTWRILVTDVSGQPINPILKGHAVLIPFCLQFTPFSSYIFKYGFKKYAACNDCIWTFYEYNLVRMVGTVIAYLVGNLVTDVAWRPISPILKGSAVQVCLTTWSLKMWQIGHPETCVIRLTIYTAIRFPAVTPFAAALARFWG